MLMAELRNIAEFRTTKLNPDDPRFVSSGPQVLRGVCPHGCDWSCHVSVGILVPPTGEYLDPIQFKRALSVFCAYRMTIDDYAEALARFFCKATQPMNMREPGLSTEACIVKLYGHTIGCRTCYDTRQVEIVEHPDRNPMIPQQMQAALQLHNDPRMNQCHSMSESP